jgi:ribonuclease E
VTPVPAAAPPAVLAAGTAIPVPTFQPPVVIFQPPDINAAPPAATAGRRRPAAEPETAPEPAAEVAPDPEASAAEQEDAGETGSRRRRRGGRGHGRVRTGDDAADAADQPAAPAGEADGGGGNGPDQAADDDGEGTGGRRRRRRRRSGSGGDGNDTPDDPPNTVVHVRAPRAATATTTTDVTDVRAVRGSTRLEAKRQRRREGRESGRRRPPIITESEFLARREAVSRIMVVRQRGDRTQIAVLEDGILVEHYVDKASSQSYVGNVYLGKVQNVLPSMEAAFVDVGKGRNAVLYAGEVNFDASGLEGESKRIESALKSGQSILTQVTKDPIGHKGARLTSQVSLPGRYLVLVPGSSMTGISRKLPDTERSRLKAILKQIMPEGAGVIVRTAAEGASEDELARDVSRLAAQWETIERKAKTANAPELLYGEPDLTIRVVRDIFNEDFTKLVIDSDGDWDLVDEYVRYVAPHLAERMERWTDDGDVFVSYRVDEQLAKALERKVWLPSGGSLVIDNTEAMTVIDVNTGKFTGQGGNLEQTVTRNNLEAAEEIVRQLRLRDVGGIIVIDFIDMVLESNRDLVLRRLLECLARDRTKHQVAEVTSLGLVQMTRKRVGSGLLEAFSVTCEHCNGRGVLVSMEPVDHSHPREEDSRGSGEGKSRGRGSRSGRQGRNGNGRNGNGDDSPADARDDSSSRDDYASSDSGSGPDGTERDEGSARDGSAGDGSGRGRAEGRNGRDGAARDGGARNGEAAHESNGGREGSGTSGSGTSGSGTSGSGTSGGGISGSGTPDGGQPSNGSGPRRVARAAAVRAAGPPKDEGDVPSFSPRMGAAAPPSSGASGASVPADSLSSAAASSASGAPAGSNGSAVGSGPVEDTSSGGGTSSDAGRGPVAGNGSGQPGHPAGANGGVPDGAEANGGPAAGEAAPAAEAAPGAPAGQSASGSRRRRGGRSRSQGAPADGAARPASAGTAVADQDRNS